MPRSRGPRSARRSDNTSPAHNSAQAEQTAPDSKGELSPLHSPLLEGSSLVSFPRLNDMLKFGRSSRLFEIGMVGGLVVGNYLSSLFHGRT